MKKIISFLIAAVAIVIFCGCSVHTTVAEGEALIRIHIRANSNDSADQTVKLKVRDEITKYLNREIGDARSFSEAYAGIEARLGEIERIGASVLGREGYDYGCRARLNEEFFPTRAYENVVVNSGYYDALIVELGSGKGDNWWCVIYPPLCFVSPSGSGGEIRYRSIIAELWRKFIRREEDDRKQKCEIEGRSDPAGDCYAFRSVFHDCRAGGSEEYR